MSIAGNAWQHQEFERDIVNQYVLDYATTSGYFQKTINEYNKTQNQAELSESLETVRMLHYPYMVRKYGNANYIGENVQYLSNYFYPMEWVNGILYDAVDSAKTNALSDEQLVDLQKVDQFFKDYDESVFKDDFAYISLYELKRRLKDFNDRYPNEN